jgi:hypothetical protein
VAHLCAHDIYEMLVLLCRQHGLAPQSTCADTAVECGRQRCID